MKRLRNLLVASVGLLTLALAVSQLIPGRAIAQQAEECVKICDEVPLSTIVKNLVDVKISNDSESPIPTRVHGPIEIASSPRTAVRTRSGLQVTDVFQREVTITLEPNDLSSSVTFTVPQSRLLVIEGWSGFAQTGHPVQFPKALILTTGNGSPGGGVAWPQQGGGGWFLNKENLGPLYADPDSTVEVRFIRSNGIGTATMTLTLTGTFVDQ